MAGRHLRRPRGRHLRTALVVLFVLALGAAAGAGGSLLLEERPEQVDTGAGPVGSGTARLEPEPGPITLAFVGDVRTRDEAVPGPFADVLAGADLAIAPVEAAIVEQAPADAGDASWATPSLLDALSSAGVDIISLATDRSLDLGDEGLYQTLAVVQDRPGTVVGIGADEDEAYAPVVRRVGGHEVAVIGATQVLEADRIATDTAGPETPGVASAKRVDRLVAEIRAARATADTVVVFLHWGVPGEECPSAGQQELAAALVEAGADVVAGSGAGRIQGVGRLDTGSGTGLVAYGLGGFLLDVPEVDEAGVLLVQVDGRDVVGQEWVPGRIGGGAPTPLEGQEAEVAVSAWDARRECAGLAP